MAKSTRLASLDILRGMAVAFMIIVNTPGSQKFVYAPLRHSEWHGCTPADLVFPFFMFIVGMAAFYSLKNYGNELNGKSVLRITRRIAAIFAIGLLLNIFPYFGMNYSTLRIMGVLQRIALAYGLAAFICISVRRDYLWIVVAGLLLIYWGLLAFLGGADPYGLETNFVLKTDLAILGRNHLYTGFGTPFDPLGLLSTIPAACTVIIGYYIGEMTGKVTANGRIVIKLLLLGIAATGLGYLWGMIFPVNKPLWTSSYVLFSGGIAMIILAPIYLIADVFKFQKWAMFFTIFGTNALFSYFLASLWAKLLFFIKIPWNSEKLTVYDWIYTRICVPLAGNLNGSLMFAVLQMLLIWGVALVLFRKKIMIRL